MWQASVFGIANLTFSYMLCLSNALYGSSTLGVNGILSYWHIGVKSIYNIFFNINQQQVGFYLFLCKQQRKTWERSPEVHVSSSSPAGVSASVLQLDGCSLKHLTGRRCTAGSSCLPWKHLQSTRRRKKKKREREKWKDTNQIGRWKFFFPFLISYHL